MHYETPTIDVIESASQVIEASNGPFSDGGGYQFSMGWSAAPLEAELEEGQ